MVNHSLDRSAVSFRPIRPDDEAFLYRLYTTVREDVEAADWDEAQKTAFLEMQFRAQHTFYQEHFTQARFDLILLNDEPIGRLYLDRRTEEIRIIDIALLPAYRNGGLGTILLKEVLEAGTAAKLPIRIHVELDNPALHLYQRLGFVQLQEDGLYYLMERRPETSA